MNAIIILAAGASSRLGTPKQNLNYNGETLLQTAITQAKRVSKTVLVVLGANRENIEFSVKDQSIEVLYNPQWPEGMASSIRLAIEKISNDYLQVSSATIMLCDQPHADSILLKQLADSALKVDKGIVASAYKNTVGAPALFKRKYFPYLLALNGTEGAKKLLDQHADDMVSIEFPLGAIDIDTPTDWKQFTADNK
ncbi:NTP transferase domain-containing protein [Mucilaginibacter sp.]|uniref:nucleotidyltransferase family protein n=1 Tax=Mucilaginibacter sp. TaxID=1882438 RepID=UPI0035BC1D6C